MRVLTAENGRAGQPANQKGNEIKISFSDTMYSSIIHIIFSRLWLSCHVKHSAVVGGASKLLIDHIIPLYLTAMLALSSLGSYIFTVLQIYMHRVCFFISGIPISRRAWQPYRLHHKASDNLQYDTV